MGRSLSGHCESCGADVGELCRSDCAARAAERNDPVALTGERKNTHGDWHTQSTLADNLMFQLTHSTNWEKMGGERRQALFNIAQKMSRICTGDPYVEDHWDDIAGYAYLGKGGHGK